MSVLDEYNTFKANLDAAIDETLLLDIAPSIVDDLLVSVVENVYNPYDAVRTTEGYQRRYGDGGLMDKSNYQSWIEGIHELNISNETRGNSDYRPPASEGWDSGYITDIIEKGEGYHWKNSSIYGMQPFPRPFMEEGLEMGISDGSIERLLAMGLATRGFTK